jgi:hypothetical protein
MDVLIFVALHTGVIRDPGLYLWNIHDMGRVAIGAGRDNGWISFPQLPFDHLLM